MLKKYLALLLVLVTALLSVPACVKDTPDMNLGGVDGPVSVGDEITMELTDRRGKAMSNEDVFWSTDAPEVATVSKEGVVTVKGSGFCRITVKHREDLSCMTSAELFCPYETVESVEASWAKSPDDWSTAGLWDAAAKFTWKYGKMMVKSLTGKMGSVGIALTVLDFFSKDNYMFSTVTPLYDAEDVILYTVCDWGNGDGSFLWENVTPEAIGKNIQPILKKDHEYGESFHELIALMRTQLASELANDGTYHLTQMNDAYEYRVVVRADFSTCTSMDFYSNGLLTGLGLSIQEIANLEVMEICDNYTYQIRKNEILNVEDLRICVEYREKG